MWGVFFILLAFTSSAQTVSPPDSAENKSINVDNPNSVQPQSVTISETTNTNSKSLASVVSNSNGTERIRIYSGGHDGNNVVKIIEVPLPERK